MSEGNGLTESLVEAEDPSHPDTPLSPVVDNFDRGPAPESLVSDGMLYMLTVNVVVGSGIVGMPFAFQAAGAVTSVAFTAAWTVVYALTLSWLVAALSRPLCAEPLDWIGLVREWLGPKGEMFAVVVVLSYTYGLLWSYASMFSASATLLVTSIAGSGEVCDIYDDPSASCISANRIAVTLFGAVMIPVSMVDLEGQQGAQALFTAYRFIAIALMLGTVLAAVLVPSQVPDRLASLRGRPGGGWFDGLGIAFSTISTSQMNHLQVPALFKAARYPDHALGVFCTALCTSALLSSAVGCLSLYFGAGTEQLATLNWKTYDGRGFGDGEGRTASIPAWALAIRVGVMFLPVITTISSFPISAIVLANNIDEALPKRWTDTMAPQSRRLLCRVLAVGPPIVLTALLHKLAVVFDVTGLFR